MSEFHDNMLEGNQIKGLARVLLEKSGYPVLPYGSESTISGLISELGVRDTKKSRTVVKVNAGKNLYLIQRLARFFRLELSFVNVINETQTN